MTILRFDPADPPRSGTLLHRSPSNSTTETPDRTPIGDAFPRLLADEPEPDSAGAYLQLLCRHALGMVQSSRLLPTVTDGGHDAWRVGTLSTTDRETLDTLAAAHADVVSHVPAIELLDAVADVVARTPAAEQLAGTPVFTTPAVHHVPDLRTWASQVALERAVSADDVTLGLRLDVTGDDAPRTTVNPFLHPVDQAGISVEVATLWQAPDFRTLRTATMSALRTAAAAWPPLRHLLTRPVPGRMDLADDDVEHLLRQGIHDLAAAGVTVHGPRSLLRGVRAQAVLSAQPDHITPGTARDLSDELTLSWRLDLDGLSLSRADVDRLADAHRPLVRMDDRWVFVDRDAARTVQQDPTKHVSGIQALEAALTGEVDDGTLRAEVAPTEWVEAIRARLTDPHHPSTARVAPPPGLKATLRHYQLRGLQWLASMTSLGLGCCLADDMGLGKTVTVIALHLHRQQALDPQESPGPTLVVCPASVLGTWEHEIHRFAPATPVHRYHGPGRVLADLTEDHTGTDAGFVLTTYATMRTDAPALGAHPWGMVVADEAQHVKNPSSSTAQALRAIPAPAKVALTGTPVENNLTELWSILDWATPGLLGPLARFRSRWAEKIESGTDPSTTERFARLVQPFLLRRHKTDPTIAPELPPKTESDHHVDLSPEQVGLYEAVVGQSMEQIRTSDGMARRGAVMSMLTALKQICNHPTQYLKQETLDTGEAKDATQRSGKLEAIDELVDTILAEDGQVLVFTQYVAMARLLDEHLRSQGIRTQLLHGGTPVPTREAMVAQFQSGQFPVFLLSLKAAGTGLTLTAADHVIHYDRWWNPAVEDQATDRAYRIGQTHPVQVHRLIAEGTIEERIGQLLERKRALAESVLAGGESALSELSDTEIESLVSLRRSP